MKHIKTYKIFESSNIEDLKDICLELEDDGFTVRYFEGSFQKTTFAEIRIKKGNYISFKYNLASETVERLKEYLGSNLIRIDILYGASDPKCTRLSYVIDDYWYDMNIEEIAIEYK